jgi:hypothetical protein
MLYDLASEPPQPGSLLESVLLLVAKRRQEAEYFSNKAIVSAIVAAATSEGKVLEEALTFYKDSMFPFLEGEKERQDRDHKKVLEHWTGKRAFQVKPLWRATESRSVMSKLRKGREKVLELEEERRKRKYRRLK